MSLPQTHPTSPPSLVASHFDAFTLHHHNNNCDKNSDDNDDDDQYEQQQLISNLLSSSTASSPYEATSFQQVKFVSYPYFLPLSELSSSSYITINGNEETCGSSFSDTDSSVMASFDTSRVHISGAFSGLFTPDENDEFFGGGSCSFDVTAVKSRDRREGEDDVWDWSVFLAQGVDCQKTEERD